MANGIDIKTIVGAKALEGLVKTNTELKKANELLKQQITLLGSLNKEYSGVKNAVQLKTALNKQEKINNTINEKQKTITQKNTALQNERIRVEKKKKQVLAQTLALEEKGTKTLLKGQARLKEARRKANEEARKSLGLAKKSGGLFRSMAKGMLAAGAAALSIRAVFNVFKNGIKTIANFEQAMSKVRAVTGALPKDFKELQANAKLLGSTTSKTATEVAGLQLEFSKLGFSTQEILNATEATISLSIAAGSDLAESAVVAASTIRGFGLDANETQRVVDVMAESFASSALDLEKFKTSMAAVAPIAKANGKDIEFVTARLSVLSDAGIDASTSGTSLRNIFLELSKRGLTWEEGLAKINNSTNKNVTALELFGKRGATAALVLADNTEKAAMLEKKYNLAAGSAKKMADIMEDNLIGDSKKLSSAWEGVILGFGKADGLVVKLSRGIVQLATTILGGNKATKKRIDLMKIENKGMNASFEALKNGKLSREAQIKLIGKINTEYGDYLPNLLNEKSTLEDIKVAQDTANKAYKTKIIQQAFQQEINDLLQAELKILESAATAEIAVAEGRAKIKDDQFKSSAELFDIEKDQLDQIDKLNKSFTEGAIKNNEKEVNSTKEKFRKIAELYNIAFAEIEGVLNEATDDTEELTTATKKQTKAIEEQTKAIEEQIDSEFGLIDVINQRIADDIEERKKAADKKKAIEADWAAYFEKLNKDMDAANVTRIEKEITDEEKLTIKLKEEADKRRAIFYALADGLQKIGNTAFSFEQRRLDAELDALRVNYDSRIQAAEGNSELQEALSRELAQKQWAIQVELAKSQRNQALFDIAINTAVGVSKALATEGPIGILTGVLVAAAGLAQIALVSSEPLPQAPAFHAGVFSSPDTFIAGDKAPGSSGDSRELILTKGGKAMLTPNHATLYEGMQGTTVIPNAQTEQILGAVGMANAGAISTKQLEGKMDMLNNTMKKSNVNITNNYASNNRYNERMIIRYKH